MIEYVLRCFFSLSLLSNAISEIFRLLIPIIIFIIIITIVNIVYKYCKYGAQIFPKFKYPEIDNYQQNILINSINKLDGNRKVLSLNNSKSDLLIIDEKGIYLLLYYNQYGTLTGHMNDEKLKLKKRENIFNEVDNPFKIILEEEIKLLKIIGDIPIKKYIIFDNNCNVQVEGVHNIEPVFLRNIDHVLKSELKKIHPKNIDVDVYYNKLTLKTNNNP